MPKDVLTAALDHLAGARHPRADAVRVVPAKPGLYAFYGDPQAWTDLALSPTFGGQPLYVGKAERSLNGRDIGTHFATGKTGSSTVRRSLAALLAGRFELVPVPRNLAKPDGSANYALESSSDAPLSAWVEERLTLAFWVQSPESLVLDEVETAVVRRLRPPLNLDKVGERRDRLRAARRRMADLARTWPVRSTKRWAIATESLCTTSVAFPGEHNIARCGAPRRVQTPARDRVVRCLPVNAAPATAPAYS